MDEPESSRLEPASRRAGRIRQTIVHWCFDTYWDVEETCRVARDLGCEGVELVEPEHWPTLRKYGLQCTLARSHPFDRGMNDPRHWPMCFERIRAAIDHCAQFGFPNVVTLTGLRDGIPDEVGLRNCVEGYRQIVPFAEEKNVTLCLEIINSRADRFMHGRPGYQGDHADYCLEIVRQVDSPRFKFLFDIYHVQVMDGDVITRIRESAEWIGHYHTAGNPGRCEPDDRQELNYPAILRAILETGYTGFVGQEFIPTRDPLAGLAEAVRLCDVGLADFC